MRKILVIGWILTFYSLGFSKVTVLEKEVVPRKKYSITYSISIDNGKFPTKETMQKIADTEKANNKGFENYFIHFLLPGMQLNNGAYAISNTNGYQNGEVKILYDTLTNTKYEKYLDFDKNGSYMLKNIK